MSTTVPAYRVPAELSAFINVIEMYLSRDGLEEMFLDRFMEMEKPRIQDSRLQTVSVCVKILYVIRTLKSAYPASRVLVFNEIYIDMCQICMRYLHKYGN